MLLVETGHLTSELMWQVTLITLLIDTTLLIPIARWVSSELFDQLQWYLVGAATLVYAVLWGTFGSVYFWDTVYVSIFPAWSRWWLPVGFGMLFGALALVFWRVSSLTSRYQVVWFILLGGMISIVGHSVGIIRGLLQVPLLAEVSPVSALTFGVVEFIFYWCLIVGLGFVGRWLSLRLRQEYG